MEEKLYSTILQDYKNREDSLKKEVQMLKDKLESFEIIKNSLTSNVSSKEAEVSVLKEKVKTLESQKAVVKEIKTVYRPNIQNIPDTSELHSLLNSFETTDLRGDYIYGYSTRSIASNAIRELNKFNKELKNNPNSDVVLTSSEIEYLNLDSVKQDLRKELEKEYKKEIEDLKSEVKSLKLAKETDVFEKEEKHIRKINELKTLLLEDKRTYDDEVRGLNNRIEDLKTTIRDLENRDPEKYISKIAHKTLRIELENIEAENNDLRDQISELEWNITRSRIKYDELKKKKQVNIFNFFKKVKLAA